MASIDRRHNKGRDTWRVKWRVDGKQKTTTVDTHEEARRVKLAVELHGDYIPTGDNAAGVPTVRQQADTYLAVHTRAQPPTLREYRRIIDQHILPSFGDVMVTAMTVPLLTTWGRGLAVSDKTRANITAVMSGILESAVPEWLPANPWRKVRLPTTDEPKDQHFLEWEAFGLIVAEIPEHYRPLVLTLGTTGMRWGEAAALSVADVDVRGEVPVFRVRKAMKHRARQTDAPGQPKTRKAVRVVAGPPELLEPIRFLTEGRSRTAPLFPTVRGKRVRNSTFHTLVWQPALDRVTNPEHVPAGTDEPLADRALPFRPRIHDLRAAATTWLIDDGMPMQDVADMMGHESLETTNAVYRRTKPGAGARASQIMSAGLRRALPAPPEQAG